MRRKWRNLRKAEKLEIERFIIGFWEEKANNRIEIDFGYRKIRRKVTYDSVIAEVKDRYGVDVSYCTVAKIIRGSFKKHEPKIFLPDSLVA